jgi:hypothetical protein
MEGANPPGGGSPYSPSRALEEEEKMDWSNNMKGVKDMFNRSPSTQEEEGAPGPSVQQQPGQLVGQHAGQLFGQQVEQQIQVPAAGGSETAAATSGPDLQQRVSSFMSRAREKMVMDIRDRMGEDTRCYDAISSLNKRATLAPDLLGGPKGPAKTLRGLVDVGDGRVMSGGLQLNFSSKRIVCTSFDKEWKCLRCGGHGQEPAFKIRGAANSSSPMQVVVLADQTFPAILPADGQARCMQIILVENGSIPDIIDEFQKQLGNRRVPPGSVLLIFSASHLLNVGLAQYAADLVEGIKLIEGKLGKETIVQPLPSSLTELITRS